MSGIPVLITGMHRSGTSLVANLLKECGLYLGQESELIPADRVDNPAGYWEFSNIVEFSDQLLNNLDASWSNPANLYTGEWLEKIDFETLKIKALNLFEPLINSSRLWGWKDPRGSLLLPFWKKLFPNLKVVICIRNPLEVALSLSKRERFHISFFDGLSLWRNYAELIVKNLGDSDYLITHYEAIIYTPDEEIQRLCKFLDIEPRLNEIKYSTNHVKSVLYRSVGTDRLLRSFPNLPENMLKLYDLFVGEAGRNYQRIILDNSLQNQLNQDALLRLYTLMTQKFDSDYQTIVEQSKEKTKLLEEIEKDRQKITFQENEIEKDRQKITFQENEIVALKKRLADSTNTLAKLNQEIIILRKESEKHTFLEENFKATITKLDYFEKQLYEQSHKRDKLKNKFTNIYRWVYQKIFPTLIFIVKKIYSTDSRRRRMFKKFYYQIARKFVQQPKIFDPSYYLEQNVDVAQSGSDPFLHYITHGYLEGRKPHPLFDPIWYLSQNQDVLEAQVEPFTHYLQHGWKEGRNPHFLFDTQYYLNKYPEIQETNLDPFSHFWLIGWKEGRNPHPEFDTKNYLIAHPELEEFNINPLYHYIRSGFEPIEKTVSDVPKPIFGITNSIESDNEGLIVAPAVKRLRKLKSIEDRIKGNLRREPKMFINYRELSSIVLKKLKQDSFVISLSQDNYIKVVGGVQIFVWDEQTISNHTGMDYLHLSPYYSKPRLAYSNEKFYIRVILNGERIGVSLAEDVLQALELILKAGNKMHHVAIHHLLGFNIDWVNKLLASVRDYKADFWLHDHFSICPGYTLLRNDVIYCGVPNVESNACRLCVYGPERLLHHGPALKRLFEQNEISVYAPSEFSSKFWKTHSSLSYSSIKVLEHASIIFTHEPLKQKSSASLPLKIAYLGNPIFYKGWEEWKKILSEFSQDERYQFFHFGMSSEKYLSHKFIQTMVTKENRFAMVDALKAHSIDVCFLWSICPESFSFTLYESIAAGCYILSHKDSGNIQDTVKKRNVGEVFESIDMLVRKMKTDAFFRSVTNYREKLIAGALKIRLLNTLN